VNGHLKWWQRPAYIASIAALVAAVALGTLGVSALITNDALDRLDQVAGDNRATLEAIERNQAGVDELVDFVHDLQQAPPDDNTEQVVNRIFVLLCASEDPVRIAACTELGLNPGEVHP